MLNLKTTFVLAEMFSIALGEVYVPDLKENLTPSDPLIISGILDKFSNFLDHNNSLRGSTKLGDPLLTNEVVYASTQEINEDLISLQARQLAAEAANSTK